MPKLALWEIGFLDSLHLRFTAAIILSLEVVECGELMFLPQKWISLPH
jgi:hypothetical protein